MYMLKCGKCHTFINCLQLTWIGYRYTMDISSCFGLAKLSHDLVTFHCLTSRGGAELGSDSERSPEHGIIYAKPKITRNTHGISVLT